MKASFIEYFYFFSATTIYCDSLFLALYSYSLLGNVGSLKEIVKLINYYSVRTPLFRNFLKNGIFHSFYAILKCRTNGQQCLLNLPKNKVRARIRACRILFINFYKVALESWYAKASLYNIILYNWCSERDYRI